VLVSLDTTMRDLERASQCGDATAAIRLGVERTRRETSAQTANRLQVEADRTLTLTLKTWESAKLDRGWWADAARSPIHGEPKGVVVIGEADADGVCWAPTRDRSPREGFLYAVAFTSYASGFKGRSSKRYYSLVRRPIRHEVRS
jgi:hypothetical protein